MAEPKSPLVHTDEAALNESKPSQVGTVQSNRAISSVEERSVHTGKVSGSTPLSPTTTFDPIAYMLADPGRRLSAEERFWPKVMKPLDWTACWPWTASKRGRGAFTYGRFKINGRDTISAHRVAYALYYGRSPGHFFVLHSCDNPPCVNPAHLRLGTVQDNTDDMMKRGRWRSGNQVGESNGAAKLTGPQVDEIRALIRAKMTNKAIAARYGVTHQAISRIRRGRSWGDEPMQPKYASLRR